MNPLNNLGVYHEWILCSICCWTQETNWVYLYEIVICYIIAFLHISCGGNYSCITKHIFAIYLHLYFFLTSVWSSWIKFHYNGTRPRYKYRWWCMKNRSDLVYNCAWLHYLNWILCVIFDQGWIISGKKI